MERKSAAIACRRFPGTHSVERIAEVLTNIHNDFGLDPEKIVATVIGNRTNFVKAFRKFGVNILENFVNTENSDDEDEVLHVNDSQEDLVEDDRAIFDEVVPKHLRCASHTLHLVAAVDTIKIIEDSRPLTSMHFRAMGKCTVLWNSLQSPPKNDIVKEFLGAALLRLVIIRWNSFQDCLERLICFKEQIMQVSPQIGITNLLTENDFSYIEEYVRIMKPISQTINILQGEHYCYYSYVLPSLVSLRRKLEAMLSTADLNSRFGPLIKGIIESLERRFTSFFSVDDNVAGAVVAVVIHPRFKMRWINVLPEEKRRRVHDLVLQAANEEYREVGDQASVLAPCDDDFFDFGEVPQTSSATHGSVSDEIARYSACSNTDLEMLIDFPIMKKIFIKFNTPLPSLAPVERLFSYATMINVPKFNRLSDKRFERRVLLKANREK